MTPRTCLPIARVLGYSANYRYDDVPLAAERGLLLPLMSGSGTLAGASASGRRTCVFQEIRQQLFWIHRFNITLKTPNESLDHK